MESTTRFERQFSILKQAVQSFRSSLQLNLGQYDDITVDTIKNGQIQKFEYCAELCWKTIKSFLNEFHGIVAISPKSVFKELYLVKYVDESEYESLIEMVNDRNRLSHIYNQAYFDEIYKGLPRYLELIHNVIVALQK